MLITLLLLLMKFFGAEIVPVQNDFEEIKKVSIVIPIYNEEQSLPQLLERTLAACQRLKQPYELILVDDGSVDNSANLLIAAAEIRQIMLLP